MLDFVGIYTKVEFYDETKVAFRIYRRQLSPDMSRKWFLSIGPGCGGMRTEHDVDLYSAPGSVDGPAVCFIDELPPRNKWEPVNGSGMEGTRGPSLLWIPKMITAAGPGAEVQNHTSPLVQSNNGNSDANSRDGYKKREHEDDLPPSQIIVHRRSIVPLSLERHTTRGLTCNTDGEPLPPSSPSTTDQKVLDDQEASEDVHGSADAAPQDQNIFRAMSKIADIESATGNACISQQEKTMPASDCSVVEPNGPRAQHKPKVFPEIRKPKHIVEPSKSTDTMATVASSTFDTAEPDVKTIDIIDEAGNNAPKGNRDCQQSLFLKRSNVSLSDLDVKKTLYEGIVNFANLLELPEGCDDMVLEGDSAAYTDSDIADFSDLSDGEDGVEEYENAVIQTWMQNIDRNKEKHKVVKWTDQIEEDTAPESCHEGNNGSQNGKTDDEDYHFYARTVGKQSLIAGNIGAALRRSTSTWKNVDAAITTKDEKAKCARPGSCRCPACKHRIISAYLELERGEFYEI